MKPTISKDGEKRFTIRVPVRAGRLELVDAICCMATRYGIDGEDVVEAVKSKLKSFSTRKAAIKAVGDAVMLHGDNFWIWCEQHSCSSQMEAELRLQVHKLVSRKFPELF